MGRPRKQRRNAHGSAWHWKQTNCWYYTLPGTKKRMPLFDENGERIRGRDQQSVAEQALARLRLSGDLNGTSPVAEQDWIVARVCSEYLQHCERSVACGAMSRSHHYQSTAYLNDLCGYCGALKVGELRKSHIQTWIANHSGWRSLATHRSVIAIVLAAFNRAEQMHDVPSPLKGLKKPPSQPRLSSLSPEDEKTLYETTDDVFGQFLLAAVHTGLRPFCELAKLTADHVEVTDRGMMWRVFSSKTKKTRKIPVHRDVAKLTTRLMAMAPRGSGKPLFRNSQDKPWTPTAGVVRFIALTALLTDLKARGLLHDTLVVWGASLVGPRQPRETTDANTIRLASRCGWPGAACAAAWSTERPTNSAGTPSRRRSMSTTCMPRSCI